LGVFAGEVTARRRKIVLEDGNDEMGKGEFNYASLAVQELPWEDIKKHNTKTDAWIVIDGSIYDISNWAKKHPGGRKIISNYAGEDATVSK